MVGLSNVDRAAGGHLDDLATACQLVLPQVFVADLLLMYVCNLVRQIVDQGCVSRRTKAWHLFFFFSNLLFMDLVPGPQLIMMMMPDTCHLSTANMCMMQVKLYCKWAIPRGCM